MYKPDYESIIENATDYAIFTMDLNRQINFWNRGAERLLGWTKKEAIGQLGDIIFPEESRAKAIRQELKNASENGSAIDERWHIRKDGSQLWAIGRLMSITDDAGNTTGYVKVLLDQTEQKQYEQKLKKLNDSLEEKIEKRTRSLLSNQKKLRSLVVELTKAEESERQRLASDLHDNLGQILAVCRMELELSQNKAPDHEGSQEIGNSMALLDEAIRYTRELMSDLKLPAELNKENLRAMMTWLVNTMSKRGLEIRVEDDKKAKPLREEVRIALIRAVREALFNVLKHAESSEVQITLKKQKNSVQVTITDRGKGFDPENKALAQTEEGGYGLSNMRERLHIMGGNLEIHSEPEKGTSIILNAPLKDK